MEAKSVRNIFCIGRNYVEHAKELGNAIPEKPVVFLKPSGAFVFDPKELAFPSSIGRLDPEVEVVVVIGRTGQDLSEAQALDYISGYAVGLDFTARDEQTNAKAKGLPWLYSKGRRGFGPISPVLSAEKVGTQAIDFSLKNNGVTRQTGCTSQMLFSIPKILSYLSVHYGLEAGDLIFTGTPAGVGPVQFGDRLHAVLNCGEASVSMELVVKGSN